MSLPALQGSEYLGTICSFDMGGGISAGNAAIVWPTANLALYLPIYVKRACTVVSFWWENGGTVSGNVDCGLYDCDLKKISSTGSTAQAGAGAQSVNVTNFKIKKGGYYIALVLDNATGIIGRGDPNGAGKMRSHGALQQATAFPLPASATPAAVANSYWPICGMYVS